MNDPFDISTLTDSEIAHVVDVASANHKHLLELTSGTRAIIRRVFNAHSQMLQCGTSALVASRRPGITESQRKTFQTIYEHCEAFNELTTGDKNTLANAVHQLGWK